MKQRWIAAGTALILLIQFLSLPASALGEQMARLKLTTPRADYGAGRRGVSLAEPAPDPAPEETVEGVISLPDFKEIDPIEPPTEGVETLDAIELLATFSPYRDVLYSFGLDVSTQNGRLLSMNSAFRAELVSPTLDTPAEIGGWLSENGASTIGMQNVTTTESVLDFLLLANPLEIRVPDSEFRGWYVFPNRDSVPNSSNWRYAAGFQAVEPNPTGGTTLTITQDFASYPSGTNRLLPLVARWEPSSVAKLRAAQTSLRPVSVNTGEGTALTDFYTTAIGTAPLSNFTPVSFSPDTTEYYLRVPADVATLNITLATFEPYYQYFTNHYGQAGALTNLPVTAQVTFGGAATQLSAGFLSNSTMMPVVITNGMRGNSTADPARAHWSTTVPLQMAAGDGKLYNDLTVTVTAPDGVTQTVYTFHIQRLAEPTMTLNPGNTPVGMIERDTSAAWGSTAEARAAAKAAAKEFFRTNRTFDFANNKYPMDAQNSAGSLYRGSYARQAWGSTADVNTVDYDCDPYAIVVYQDSAFLDPGIVGMTDALGRPQAISGAVSRTIKVRTAAQLTTSLIQKNSGTEAWYTNAGGPQLVTGGATSDLLTTTNGGGNGDVVDLRGLNVIPGIYFIEYSYQDTAAAVTYDSSGASFPLRKDNAKTFRRALIVLPIPGDIDMDGMVTPLDSVALTNLAGLTSQDSSTRLNSISVGLTGTNRDPVVDLVFYRVCDVNGNMGVNVGESTNSGDVLILQGGYMPRLVRGGQSDYFYIPLPNGGVEYTRTSILSGETTSASFGNLTLEFLGVQKGQRGDGGLYAGTPADPDYTGNSTDTVTYGDTFWVGVKLTGAENTALSGKGIQSFTATLTYDSRYVQPIDVLTASDVSSGRDFWEVTMLKYNVGAKSQTLWGTNKYESPTFGLDGDRAYLTNYTKAITPLEKNVGSEHLREVVFSVKLRSGQTAATVQNGFLLVAPFKLIEFPAGQTNATLIEMGAGMRELALSTTTAIGAFSSGDLEITPLATGSTGAAYSGQTNIYGGATENLRSMLKYPEGLALTLAVGEDNTPTEMLYNTRITGQNAYAVYGEPFQSKQLNGLLGAGETLPPGLSYGNTGGQIVGTPTAAGDYTFRIGQTRYRLIVEKAEIRFYAGAQRSFYGQPEFREDGNANFLESYYYYTADIKQVDLARASGVANDGLGATLESLVEGYTKPTFRAVLSDGVTQVLNTTSIGTYAVICPTADLPTSKNYTFKLAGQNPASGSSEVNLLRIVPRPVQVAYLTLDAGNGEYAGELYDDSDIFHVTNTATYDAAGGVSQFVLESKSSTGLYNGERLNSAGIIGNDVLVISYKATFIRTAADEAAGPIGKKFSVSHISETRQTAITEISAAADQDPNTPGVQTGAAANYQLIQGQNNAPTGNQAMHMVYGVVLAQRVTSVVIANQPTSMVFQYGDYFPSVVRFRINYLSKDGEVDIVLNDASWGSYRLTPTWLTEAEMQEAIANPTYPVGAEGYEDPANPSAGLKANTISNPSFTLSYGERLTVAKHDKKYLCLSIPTWDAQGHEIYVRAFLDVLEVQPKVVELTAQAVTRFYGEPNPVFTFTYDPTQLMSTDQVPGATGKGSELSGLSGYVAPTLAAYVGAPGTPQATVPVDQTTNASSTPYYIHISGASALDYRFVYTVKRSGQADTVSNEKGSALLTIERRPIVVDTIASSISAPTEIGTVSMVLTTSNQTSPTGIALAEIYSDTKSLTVSPSTANAYCKYNNNTLVYNSGGTQEFTFRLPTHTTAVTQYYPNGGGAQVSLPYTFAAGAQPVVNGDNLKLTYTAEFIPDLGFHYDLATNHFDMTDAVNGIRYADVQVSGIQLTGDDAANYRLVHIRADDATNGYPYGRVAKTGPRAGWFDTPDQRYYVSGHGILHTRAISGIGLVKLPLMSYTYGEVFAPQMGKSEEPAPLTIQINYETIYDNTTANVPYEQLAFEYITDDQFGEPITNFRDRGMEIRYMPTGETNKENSVEIKPGAELTVTDHNNVAILVAGRRSPNDPTVYSELSSEGTQSHAGEVLTVAKKVLPITVQNQHRYYGEPNSDYIFTFRKVDLAARDQSWLSGATGTGSAAGTANAVSGLAANLGDLAGKSGYVAPKFTTTAAKTSDVRDTASTAYKLTVTEGALDNYRLVPTGEGLIYVYRRPILLNTVFSNAENPIFTVYSDTNERIFTTDVDLTKVTMKLPVAAGQNYNNSNNDAAFQQSPNAGSGRPLTGTAVVGSDDLRFTIRVEFDNYDPTQYSQDVNVRITGMTLNVSAGRGSNYCLVPNSINISATGRVQLREIRKIELANPPNRTGYTYGESLSLDGLSVKITYASLGSEGEMTETVSYVGNAQFEAYGLYLRYVNTNAAPSAAQSTGIYAANRIAEGGDHLTIAPTHDTQGTANEFSANGKYIAVLGRRHSAQSFVDGIIANAGAPIQVSPLPIQFSLVAADKTYDGTTEAVGTLTMHNIYNRTGPSVVVDRYNTNVTDVVFVKTGAANQTPTGLTTDHKSYAAFQAEVQANGYVFSSGVYVPDPNDRLNDKLVYTNNGIYGGINNDRLTFAFVNRNVAYAAEGATHAPYGALTTREVEVSNMKLAGPDAANYTLIGTGPSGSATASVTQSNLGSAVGYLSGALPRATIHKAARPDLISLLTNGGLNALPDGGLPTVQVDEHTNTVQALYGIDILDFLMEHDDYAAEDHYEYALQYDLSDSAAQVGRWAGWNGLDAYQDNRFFGGEFASVDVPDQYLTDPRNIPTAYDPTKDILRGQFYSWSQMDDGVEPYEDAYLRALMDGGQLNTVPYPTYEVYQVNRTALPRDTVFWGLVRLAETHNYEASPALSSVDGMGHELTTALRKANDALATDPTNPTLQNAAELAAGNLLTSAQTAILNALNDADARSNTLLDIADTGRWPEGDLQPPTPAPAVKTFHQRFDLVSTKKERSFGATGNDEYVIPTLEAVWFTDILLYDDKRILDAVLRNMEKTRYYDFAWDPEFTARLDTSDKQNPLSLLTAFDVEVDVRVNNQVNKEWITVNQEPVNGTPTVNTALVYVSTTPPNDDELRGLRIVPDTVKVEMGAYPVQLTVEFNPSDIKRRTVTWSSSDPEVATVTEEGILVFHGVGVTVITATAYNGKTATATVTVLDKTLSTPEEWDREMMSLFPASIFNFAMTDAMFELDATLFFHPDQQMTRGELAMFMAQFYRENKDWIRRGSGVFPDLTGEEAYAEAARLLGELGVMTGVEDGRFDGDRLVTRAELVTMLARMIFMDVPDTTGQPHAFLDCGEEDTWAYSYIDAMSRLGVLQGVGDGTFRPNRIVVRAEAAVLVDRLLRIVIDPEGKNLVTPFDVSETNWAYLSILRAVNGGTADETAPE